LSPAPIVFKILNFFTFFLDSPLVSLAKTAKPSNAVLLANGFADGDKMFFAQTLFKESDIEIFSLGKLKKLYLLFL